MVGKYKGTTVNAGGIWGGKFATAYQKSLLDFMEKTGITVLYQTIDETSPPSKPPSNLAQGRT